MDWIQEEYEALPIPTLPGSSLSVYYNCLIEPSEDGEDGAEEDERPEEGYLAHTKDTGLLHPTEDGGGGSGEEEEDEDEGEGEEQCEPNPAPAGCTETPNWGEEPVDVIAYDEFGFLDLVDPGLENALNLREPPPSFDESGLTTYNDLCRSMGLVPISRFVRQLNEGFVDLRFYGVHPRTVRAIAQALMYNPSVHTLDLSGNWLSDEAAYYLAELLLRENVALRRLALRGCRLSARAAAMLAEGVELNHSLQELDLADNELGDDGVKAMQESLAQNDELRELDLSNNHLGPAAAAALGKALQENQTIESLGLARNNLYEDVPKGLRVLLRAIQQREKSFQHLDLAWNALNASAAVSLRAFLVKSTIQELFLDHNRFSGSAINTIKIGVGKSKTLQHLKIGFNPMEAVNAMNILKASQTSGSLKILDLDGIRVSTDFIKVKMQLEKSRDISILVEGALSNYEIKGPNLGEMMLKRTRHEGLKPKKKRRKRDFGHLLLELSKNGVESMLPAQFTELALKKKKVKVREELLRALYEQYQSKKSKVDVGAMLDCYMKLFPDTVLPPVIPKKKKKKRGRKKKKGKKTKPKV